MTEQEKREMVIKGLEGCFDALVQDEHAFAENGVVMSSWQDRAKRIDAIREAITLLKAQEPRVMTRAELELAKLAPVWLDTHNGRIYNGWALCYDIQTGMGITGTRAGITDPSGRVHWLKLDDYGRTWRCWTSRPTDKQREAAAWES